MKRAQCLDAYQGFSKQASENARNLSLAAIAVVWLFSSRKDTGAVQIPSALRPVLVGSVLALTCDFLQYLIGTAFWGTYHRYLERKGVEPDVDFRAPRWMNWPTNFFFTFKFLCVVLAFTALFLYTISTYLNAVTHGGAVSGAITNG